MLNTLQGYEKTISPKTVPNTVPNLLNLIWLGSYPNATTLYRLQELRKINPSYEIVLWVDDAFLDSKEKKDLQAFAASNKIQIKDASIYCEKDNEFSETFPIYDEMRKYELSRKDKKEGVPFNYFVPMSDILRLWVLKKTGGGHYLDDDDEANKEFPLDVQLPRGFGVCIPGGRKITSNSIISAVKDSPILQEYIEKVAANYKLGQKVLGSFVGDFLNDTSVSDDSDRIDQHKRLIAIISGPLALTELLCSKADLNYHYETLEVMIAYQRSWGSWGSLGWKIMTDILNGYTDPMQEKAKQFKSPLTDCVRVCDDSRYKRTLK